MATKKVAKRVANPPGNGATIPAGFKRVLTGNFPDVFDFRTTATLQGTVSEIKNVQTKRGKKMVESRIMYVADKDGALYGVWESAALAGLFNELGKNPKGRKVWIHYKGEKKIKGQANPMHDFETAIA